MYNHYLDFLKSFKSFISGTFPGINHFQFNYADNAFLNYKLYQEHVKEWPTCIINLTDITTDDNKAFFRYIAGASSVETAQLLTSNHTLEESVVMDFKWVTMQIQVRINLYSLADLLDYHNQLLSAFPKNFMFYAYKYTALINVDNYTEDWLESHDTEGLHYRTTNQDVEAFAAYPIEPIFRMNSIVKNKMVDGETSLDVNLEVRLKVPNIVGTTTDDNRIVNGIQIIINSAGDAKDLPILIDMDNDIYSDRRRKLHRSYILTESDFDKENNTVTVKEEIFPELENRSIAIYMVDDSTSPDPEILWTEIPIFDIVPVDGELIIPLESTIDLSKFQFSQLSNTELYVFH